ncbi:MAG: (d)CMP kinase [Opitutae bacterium]|jgi:CMP/dCMP kinase|nr:(d)CMP kinase [Opitutae bacterium]
MKSFITIAIDGGAGSGKSTTASTLSTRLNFMHVDTGSHYRAIASMLLEDQVELNETDIKANLNKFNLNSSLAGLKSSLTINDKLISTTILRSESVNNSVSQIASIPCVRDLLFKYQRSQILLAERHKFNGLVMEGRDIGSVILPDADLKIYLHASDSIREQRRSIDGERDQILKRDLIDSSRKVAPLVKSEGSFLINTGELSINEVFTEISSLISEL